MTESGSKKTGHGIINTGLRGRSDRMHLALLVSAFIHAAGLGGALIASRAGADTSRKLDPDQKPIVAKLVRLGEERDPNLLPRKESRPPALPPPQQAAPPPAKTPEAPPSTKAAIVPTKKAEPEPPRKTKAPPPRPASPERSRTGSLDDAISRVLGTDPDAKRSDGPVFGSPDGDPYGDAAEASEGDRYLALVTRALRENYRVPSIIKERERMFLNATVVIYVAPNGRILRKEMERPSGNDHFDNALLRAVDASNPLPPPPRGWATRFEREGLGVNFRL